MNNSATNEVFNSQIIQRYIRCKGLINVKISFLFIKGANYMNNSAAYEIFGY